MTHDELLANINVAIRDRNADYGLVKGLYALRAVVELHKPHHGLTDGGADSDGVCLQCSGRKFEQFYPCPTIQAIEKELR